jgi:RsiW-degrading membrane proteinase PrsW (M82 family)
VKSIDHFSYLIDRQHQFLLIGIGFLVMSAVFALSGEAFERFGGIVYRDESPKRFWWDVVGCFLTGLFFIGLYFYQNSN